MTFRMETYTIFRLREVICCRRILCVGFKGFRGFWWFYTLLISAKLHLFPLTAKQLGNFLHHNLQYRYRHELGGEGFGHALVADVVWVETVGVGVCVELGMGILKREETGKGGEVYDGHCPHLSCFLNGLDIVVDEEPELVRVAFLRLPVADLMIS